MRAQLFAISLALVFSIGGALSPAFAQDNDGDSDTGTDYSKDPSYSVARDFFKVLGADQPRQNQEKSLPGFQMVTDPWPERSKDTSWVHHYLILQGENYLPATQAYVTPFVTLFALEDGYMPSGSTTSPTDETSNCQKMNSANASALSRENQESTIVAADEAAAVGVHSNGLGTDGERYGCPKVFGEIWDSGSQTMDKDHNPISEQWFSDGVDAVIVRESPWIVEDYISPEDERAFGEVEFLAIGEGGPDRLADPAIYPLPVSKMIVVDYPIRGQGGNGHLSWGKNKKPYIPGAPELPVTVFGRIPKKDEEPSVQPYVSPYAVISGIVSELEDEIEKRTEGIDRPEFLLVVRGGNLVVEEYPDEDVMERVQAIRGVLEKRGKLTTVSFGDELPICRTDDDLCWSLNRSSILYILNQN